MYNVKLYSKATEGNVKLSENFTVKEFACKDGSDPVIVSMDLVKLLQTIRNHYGKAVIINSAYRTPSYNNKVGGVNDSQHTHGIAADIVVSGQKPKDVAAYVNTLMPNNGGIGIYTTFVHVDVRTNKARWNG